jgi:hypothetical protein
MVVFGATYVVAAVDARSYTLDRAAPLREAERGGSEEKTFANVNSTNGAQNVNKMWTTISCDLRFFPLDLWRTKCNEEITRYNLTNA